MTTFGLNKELAKFQVQLYLDLQFVNDETASQLETLDVTNVNVTHFCNAVKSQISGSIVEHAAAKFNATIVGSGELNCITGTSRVDTPEAVDIFGIGFFSLQVHVTQVVVLESTNLLWLELVQSIVENGFTKVSGGGIQFRDRLQSNPVFGTVITVETREGLDLPTPPPNLSPTPVLSEFPTGRPSCFPSEVFSTIPSAEPSVWPSTVPSTVPSSKPSTEPSAMPSSKPSTVPSTGPSYSPSMTPSHTPSFRVSNVPSTVPSQQIASSPVETQDATAQLFLGRSFDTPTLAAIIAVTMTLASAFVFCLLLIFRCRRNSTKNRPFPNEIALSKKDAHGRPVIPIVVELGDDDQSLAETSLGEHTAGGIIDSRKKEMKRPIRPLGSFDENSLYTTPFPVNPDACEDKSKKVRPQRVQGTSTPEGAKKSADTKKVERENKKATNLSIESTLHHNQPPQANRSSSVRRSIPVDVDSVAPYYDEGLRITKIEPLNAGLPTVQESDAFSGGLNTEFDDEFTRDASELDVWSYNFDDVSHSSNFCIEEGESKTSSSSRKTITFSEPTILGQYSESSSESEEKSSGPPGQKDCKQDEKDSDRIDNSFEATINFAGRRNLRDVLGHPDHRKTKVRSADLSESSETSKISFSSRKAYVGHQPYSLKKSSQNSLTYEFGRPMTKLLESTSIPATAPEENETILTSASKASIDEDQNSVFHDDDSDSVLSISPWLMEETAKILGPQGKNADTESLSGRSNRSVNLKTARGRRNESETSYGSRFSAHQLSSVMTSISSSMSTDILEQTGGEISIKPSKQTLEQDKKRLEAQLAHLAAIENDMSTQTSSVTMTTSLGASLSTLSHMSKTRTKKRKRIIVLAPPGKLGVILANRHDGKGTVVAELRPNSPLEGMLSPGDKLVAVDNVVVENLECSQITSLIASKSDCERRLTVIATA